MLGFCCQLNSRNHITVCWNNNLYVTVVLISICYNLCGNSHICLFSSCVWIILPHLKQVISFFKYLPNINLNLGFLCLLERKHSASNFGPYHLAWQKSTWPQPIPGSDAWMTQIVSLHQANSTSSISHYVSSQNRNWSHQYKQLLVVSVVPLCSYIKISHPLKEWRALAFPSKGDIVLQRYSFISILPNV